MNIEEQRINERISKEIIELKTIQQEKYQIIATTNRACQAATERVKADRDSAIRDLEDQGHVTKQRIAGINAGIDQYQSQTQTQFQRNYLMQTSRNL